MTSVLTPIALYEATKKMQRGPLSFVVTYDVQSMVDVITVGVRVDGRVRTFDIHLKSTQMVREFRTILTNDAIEKRGIDLNPFVKALGDQYFASQFTSTFYTYVGPDDLTNLDENNKHKVLLTLPLERFEKATGEVSVEESDTAVCMRLGTTGMTVHKQKVDSVMDTPPLYSSWRNGVNPQTLLIMKMKDDTPIEFPCAHLQNLNLITYLNTYTFSPTENEYRAFLKKRADDMREMVGKITLRQQGVHERMLRHGSTQVNDGCEALSDIKVGDLVRVAHSALYKRKIKEGQPGRPDEDRYEIDGSTKWSERASRVVSIRGTGEDTVFMLQGHTKSFRRNDICPLANIGVGAYVRIYLFANKIFRQTMGGSIQAAVRHYEFNHVFSRTIWKVVKEVNGNVLRRKLLLEDDEGESMRYFLEPVWLPVDPERTPTVVFRHSQWETDVKRNLWSYKHFKDRLRYGGGKCSDMADMPSCFRGYRATDLLRVDKQTEALMKTPEGRDKYTKCLLKCMGMGRNPKYKLLDPVVKSTAATRSEFKDNEKARGKLMERVRGTESLMCD